MWNYIILSRSHNLRFCWVICGWYLGFWVSKYHPCDEILYFYSNTYSIILQITCYGESNSRDKIGYFMLESDITSMVKMEYFDWNIWVKLCSICWSALLLIFINTKSVGYNILSQLEIVYSYQEVTVWFFLVYL